jgi:hypothetical protein
VDSWKGPKKTGLRAEAYGKWQSRVKHFDDESWPRKFDYRDWPAFTVIDGGWWTFHHGVYRLVPKGTRTDDRAALPLGCQPSHRQPSSLSSQHTHKLEMEKPNVPDRSARQA